MVFSEGCKSFVQSPKPIQLVKSLLKNAHEVAVELRGLTRGNCCEKSYQAAGSATSLALIFGVKIAVANSEISETWQIEIEQTNRFVRTREYRLSEPRSLTWIYELNEPEPEDSFSMKLGEPHAVAAWPVKKFSVEKDVPQLDELEFDPDDPSVFFRSLNRPLLGEQIGEIPGHYSLRDYINRLVVDGRLPKRVRVEFEQTAYRAVCLVSVLSWGDPKAERENYVAKPSSLWQTFGVQVETGQNEPTQPISGKIPDLSVEGVTLGMSSNDVLKLWREKPSDLHVQYRPDRGTAVVLHGASLRVGTDLYKMGDEVAPLLRKLEEIGFQDYDSTLARAEDEESKRIRNRFRSLRRVLISPDAVVVLQLEQGGLKAVDVFGGAEGYDFREPELDWLGPLPTIYGFSLQSDEKSILLKLGKPPRIHQQGAARTLCYEERDCSASPTAEVKLHATFENGRCREIRGNQFEQAGEIKLGAGYPMPPPHSLYEVKRVLSFYNGAFQSRPAKGETGPLTVAYNTDIGMQVWIYPDGRRQFVLQDAELPETIIDPLFP